MSDTSQKSHWENTWSQKASTKLPSKGNCQVVTCPTLTGWYFSFSVSLQCHRLKGKPFTFPSAGLTNRSNEATVSWLMVKLQQAEMHRQNITTSGQPLSFSQRWHLAGIRETGKINADLLLSSFMILSLKGRFFKTNKSLGLSQYIQLH